MNPTVDLAVYANFGKEVGHHEIPWNPMTYPKQIYT